MRFEGHGLKLSTTVLRLSTVVLIANRRLRPLLARQPLGAGGGASHVSGSFFYARSITSVARGPNLKFAGSMAACLDLHASDHGDQGIFWCLCAGAGAAHTDLRTPRAAQARAAAPPPSAVCRCGAPAPDAAMLGAARRHTPFGIVSAPPSTHAHVLPAAPARPFSLVPTH